MPTSTVSYSRGKPLGEDQCMDLAEKIAASNNIRTLNLSYNTLGSWGATIISRGLTGNSSLQTVRICDNQVGDGGATEITQALAGHPSLRLLDLSSNDLGEAGGQALAELLTSTTSLQELFLEGNRLGDYGSKAIAQSIMRKACSLEALHLAGNGLGESGSCAIAMGLLANTSLRSLKLHEFSSDNVDNVLGVDGAREFGRVLLQNKSLETLWLSPVGNWQKEGVLSESMGQALRHNKTLRVLRLCYAYLSAQCAQALSDGLCQNNSLRTLEVYFESAGDGVGEAFALAIALNQSLKTLSLMGPCMHHRDFAAIFMALEFNTSLQTVSVFFRQIHLQDASTVGDALKRNRTLRCLDVTFEACSEDAITALVTSIGKSLRDFPRYHEFSLGLCSFGADHPHVPLPCLADQLDLPRGSREWTNQQVIAHLREVHIEKLIAFLMGQHVRLGAESAVRELSEDAITMMAEAYFGLPLGQLER